MKILIAAIVVFVPILNSRANEPESVALRSIGATLQETNGAITGLQVDCTKLTDADYELIGGVKTLKSLSISGKPMSDEQLALLSGLTGLESILINGSQITDDGYRHFASFKNLRTLSLFHPSRDCEAFTGAGLAHLKALRKLERLTFAGSTAGDEAYAAIGQLTQIREFREWHNWETADGKKQLLTLKDLKSLKLGQRLPQRGQPPTPSLDDATLAAIAQMTSLERLDLQEARLSFAGLTQLRALPNLKQLKLALIDISEADIDKLRAALPNVTIEWEPLTEEGETTLSQKLRL